MADQVDDIGQTEPCHDTLSRHHRLVLVLLVAAASLIADLWSKAWAWNNLQGQPSLRIIDRVFHFEFAFNTGSAFGMFREYAWARGFFIVVTAIAVIYLLRLALTLPLRYPSVFVAIGLILGGALGNLHDRLFRTMEIFGQGVRHGVVDFIVVFYWPGRRWPAFNIADAVLVAGVLLFMIYLHRHGDAPTGDPGPSSAR